MELLPTDFIAPDLQEQHGDVLFRARLKGRDTYIYLLLEHQSSPDRWMAFRMLRYVVAIWTSFREQNPGAKQFPAVVPMVIHTGHRGIHWSYPADLATLVNIDADVHNEFGGCVPQFRFLLDDLVAPGAPSIWSRDLTDLTALTLFLLTSAHENPHVLAELMENGLDRMRAVLDTPTGVDDVLSLLLYVSEVTKPDKIELRQLIDQLGPKAKEIEVTLADELRAEGEAKILVKLMKLKFGKLSDSVLETVHKATTEQLEAWAAKILTATTLDDVFAH